MKLIFDIIRWKNLLSTGNSWSEVVLNKNATTLIIGRNGHGKSTFEDALCIALFGVPFRSINKPLLVNSINGKDCVVELFFHIGPKNYKIIRGIAPNIFKVFIDDVPVDQDAFAGDYQKHLEENILKFNFKAFTQIVILGSKSFVPFMKLKSADRRNIIENLLDIEIISSMNKIAKDNLTKIKKDVVSNKTEIDNLNTQIALQQKHVEDSKKNNQELIEQKKADIVTEKQKYTTLELNEIILNGKISDVKLKFADRDSVNDSLFKLESLKNKIDTKRSTAEFQLKFYVTNDNCPTCHQSIQEEHKNSCIHDADEIIHTMDQNLIIYTNEKRVLTEKFQEIKKHVEEYHELVNEMNRLQASKSHINETINKLNKEISSLQTKKVLSDDMMKVSEKLVEDLEAATRARGELVESRAYYDTAVSMLDDGGFKAQIIKQYLPEINKLVNKYLTTLDLFVNFELNEEFEESIKSRYRDKFVYNSFSEGQKQKIDLALLFAWRDVAKLKNSMDTNLLILDEVFDSSLEAEAVDMVFSILSALPEGSNVFVISHNQLHHDKFSNNIRFVMKNNFSEIADQEV